MFTFICLTVSFIVSYVSVAGVGCWKYDGAWSLERHGADVHSSAALIKDEASLNQLWSKVFTFRLFHIVPLKRNRYQLCSSLCLCLSADNCFIINIVLFCFVSPPPGWIIFSWENKCIQFSTYCIYLFIFYLLFDIKCGYWWHRGYLPPGLTPQRGDPNLKWQPLTASWCTHVSKSVDDNYLKHNRAAVDVCLFNPAFWSQEQ